jgi:hypothetical protein
VKHFRILAALIVLPVIFGSQMVVGQSPSAFSPYVDAEGTISMPSDFREWAYLGTWSIAGDDEAGGAAGFHMVNPIVHDVTNHLSFSIFTAAKI